jgi:hypothetical protein
VFDPLHRWLAAFVTAAAVVVGISPAVGEAPKATVRQLLYPEKSDDVPAGLRPVVAKLLSDDQGTVEPADAKPAGVFVRVVSRKYVLDGRAIKQDAFIGGRPFVFVTLPETLYGRTLLQVFSAIGYSADEVLTGQLGSEKVAVVFRWGEKVTPHAGRDGKLPDDWQTKVYPSTWDNLFSLVDKMAADKDWHALAEVGRPSALTRLNFQSAKERQFVLGYPDAGKERLKALPYSALRDTKGADWDYRQFLERTLGASEHFTGDGTSQPAIFAKGKTTGFPEFLGPNRELVALPEVAIIGLGSVQVVGK